MAKQTSVNNSPATGVVAIFDLMTFMELHGWVVLEDSDGTTYEADVPANGHQVTSSGAGAGGLQNSNAWFRIREPNGNVNPLSGGIAREWIFQADSASNWRQWNVWHSALDGFIGGAPTATVPPTATDQIQIFDRANDLFPVDNTYRWHMVLYDVAEDGVYPFYAYSAINGTGLCITLIMQESLQAGSYPALVGTRAAPTSGEPDPALYCCSYNASGINFTVSGSTQGWQATTTAPVQHWYAMNNSNGATQAYTQIQGAVLMYNQASSHIGVPANTTGADGLGVNPLSGEDQLFPVYMARPAGLSTNVIGKGMTSHIRISGVDRTYPSTATIAGERWTYTNSVSGTGGGILLPFEDGTAPLT